jgi:hypothetical protein
MKKIYIWAVSLLIVWISVAAVIPKPGPTVILDLYNKMGYEEAHVSLKGLNYYNTYYLTAKTQDISSLQFDIDRLPVEKTTYEIVKDIYEMTIYVCNNPSADGILIANRNTRLVFPKCDKGVDINSGEPGQEKISTHFWGVNGFELGGASVSQDKTTIRDWLEKYEAENGSRGMFLLRAFDMQVLWRLRYQNLATGNMNSWSKYNFMDIFH